MSTIDDLLIYMKENGGSDLHLATGIEPRLRRRGGLEPIAGWPVQTEESLRQLLKGITSKKQWEDYEKTNDIDFAYGIEGVARFRANYFRQENGAAAVFRIIPEKILTLEQLKTPPTIDTFATLEQGLVLVTGPTGSGKSTTLAGIIDRINSVSCKHIITIEDPIEFVHPNKKCVFSQREVGRHTRSFASALRAAIRADANVILVGEMRDPETISLATTAAEMGVLVFGTLHTNSAAKTVDRLVDAFPSEQQGQIRQSLAESLAGVVSQLLLPAADGKGRVAVHEILVKTSGLRNIIREGNTQMLASVIQGGKSHGMQTMDDALWDMVQQNRVLPQDAYMKAFDKARFEKILPTGVPKSE